MKKPNIVYFFVDDMGIGDASCFNPEGKIPTPHLDRLAREGMKFTDAHSTSAVCSPSRYSVLTGRYNWRSRLQRGIVQHYGEPLIDADRLTVPGLLKQQGYHTACVGKWHLGQGWDFEAEPEMFYPKISGLADTGGAKREVTAEVGAVWEAAFSRATTGGPTTRGFDWYFGVDVPNWPPYVYLENDRTVGIPSEWLPDHLLGNNLASTPGPSMPDWHFEQLLPTWAEKAEGYIGERAAAGEPFFLYMAMTSPHTPLSVNEAFCGKSGLNNAYADLVMETDHVLGQVMEALERHGVAENTLVMFASDNGFAHHSGAKEPGRGGEAAVIRDHVVHHSIDGKFAIRDGQWKLVLCPGSGGVDTPGCAGGGGGVSAGAALRHGGGSGGGAQSSGGAAGQGEGAAGQTDGAG